ncbi:MAG: hypothetical protein OER56_09130, partial [Hyphomicrobiales bacterium]|nr:hypothetical protein [Hyphomicrobiales bacterium]
MASNGGKLTYLRAVPASRPCLSGWLDCVTCRTPAGILAIWLKARLVVACFLLLMSGATVHGQPGAPLTLVEVGNGMFLASGAVATADTDNLGHIANIGFIIGSKYVAVIDTGGS